MNPCIGDNLGGLKTGGTGISVHGTYVIQYEKNYNYVNIVTL